MEEKDCKVSRVLHIFEKLISGDIVNKRELADIFKVNDKTIQRDIDEIRNYLIDKRNDYNVKIRYSRKNRGYLMEESSNKKLNCEELLAITKIILESRAFNKEEMNHLINILLNEVNFEKRKHIKELIRNELFNFVPLQHNKKILKLLWELSEIIRHKEITEISYIKVTNENVTRIIKPVAIIFSEYYFYLIAYSADVEYDDPTIFRIDRILDYKKIGQRFYINDCKRFEDGEFRKRIQFMYQGKLSKVKFEYCGVSIEHILDRLPTAEIKQVTENKYLVETEVYGQGIIMWILSQGKNIKLIEPVEMILRVKEELIKILENYN
ncbi:WYL domain-containing protein [Clostridium sp. C2-6-12]|uniref:helix-turn-helix transcriptional regulator n=1 Tax=Clostridium sp. C2-6-12 TaxID=2698832 RepID=UPI001371DA0F|nr:WYL domain-containing protein [Clostridium sp. C2-6-12]